jgi:AraC-like DNA-binding protein
MGLYNNVICREDIDSLVFVLTGRCGVDFRMTFQVRMADVLLRYTDLSMTDVSKSAGFCSVNNLYLAYKREFCIVPGECRQKIRKRGG